MGFVQVLGIGDVVVAAILAAVVVVVAAAVVVVVAAAVVAVLVVVVFVAAVLIAKEYSIRLALFSYLSPLLNLHLASCYAVDSLYNLTRQIHLLRFM